VAQAQATHLLLGLAPFHSAWTRVGQPPLFVTAVAQTTLRSWAVTIRFTAPFAATLGATSALSFSNRDVGARLTPLGSTYAVADVCTAVDALATTLTHVGLLPQVVHAPGGWQSAPGSFTSFYPASPTA
jgi:hypothetical protein